MARPERAHGGRAAWSGPARAGPSARPIPCSRRNRAAEAHDGLDKRSADPWVGAPEKRIRNYQVWRPVPSPEHHQPCRSTGGTYQMIRRTVTADQESLWALGLLIAGRSRVRIGRWDGRRGKWQYSTRDERDLTAEVPSKPAAVLLYNSQARCRTLVVDVDVSGAAGLELVHRVVALLERCGARVVVDRSPAGKHHVYVPLRDGLSVEEAGALAKGLARRFPGVDPLPHTTGATSGCIRTPGSAYKDGSGFQELVTPLGTARRVLMMRNGSEVIGALRRELSEELATGAREAMTMARPLEELEEEAAVLNAPFVGRVMAPRLVTLAQEGLYQEAGYGDRS